MNTKNNISHIIIAIVLLSLLARPALAQTTTVQVSINPTLSSAAPGHTVTVAINLDDTELVAAGDFLVSYEAGLLFGGAQLTALTTDAGFLLTFEPQGDSAVQISMAAAQELGGGPGDLLWLDFVVADDAEVGTELSVTLLEAQLRDLYGRDFETSALQRAIEMQDGAVQVTEPPACTAPDDVSLTGPPAGYSGVAYTFYAAVNPLAATTPMTYTWQTAEQPAVTHVVSATNDVADFTWATAGLHSVAVTVSNDCGNVHTTHPITITAPPNTATPTATEIPPDGTPALSSGGVLVAISAVAAALGWVLTQRM